VPAGSASAVVAGPLPFRVGEIQHRLDVRTDHLGNARHRIPNRVQDPPDCSKVYGADAKTADRGEDMDLERAQPLAGILLAAPIWLVPRR
jgi:hypothetical protein